MVVDHFQLVFLPHLNCNFVTLSFHIRFLGKEYSFTRTRCLCISQEARNCKTKVRQGLGISIKNLTFLCFWFWIVKVVSNSLNGTFLTKCFKRLLYQSAKTIRSNNKRQVLLSVNYEEGHNVKLTGTYTVNVTTVI